MSNSNNLNQSQIHNNSSNHKHQMKSRPTTNNSTLSAPQTSFSTSINVSNSSNNSISSGSGGGGSGLLLRLFQSEYFNVHLAIAYLKNYPDSIGITYYLINRLNEFPEKDIEFYWPQLCHLLISRPTESFALESFLIKKCQDSTHLAMKTLWYLQSSLSDLSSTPTTRSFSICRRTFNKVQSIIFSDPLLDLINHQNQQDPRITNGITNHNISTNRRQTDRIHLKTTSYLGQIKRQAFTELAKLKGQKIGEKVLPTTVGLGLVLGGIGLPQMVNQLGSVPIEQSKDHDDVFNVDRSIKNNQKNEATDNSASEEEIDQVKDKLTRNTPLSETKVNHHQKLKIPPSRDLKGKGKSHTMIETYSPSERPIGSLQVDRPLSIDFTPGPPINQNPMSLSVYDSDSSAGPSSSAVLTPEPQSNSLFLTRSYSGESSQDASDPGCATTGPMILTAPPTFTGSFSPNPIGFSNLIGGVDGFKYNSDRPLPNSQSTSSPALSPIIGKKITKFPRPTHRSRVVPTVSQSVPSLPNALASSKLDPHQLINHRDSRGLINPLQSLSIDPSTIPSSVLNQVLKSQSMRSQLDLITNLQDISTRLVIVPKIARLSALRAELTVLNHSLPKGCCLGMYCKGEETDSLGKRRAHHRIVRISPNESVVLNSADRAPFLIHVEVLEDHLDFDPYRRSNYEDLRKALAHSNFTGNSLNKRKENMSSDQFILDQQRFRNINLEEKNLGECHEPLVATGPEFLLSSPGFQMNNKNLLSTLSPEPLSILSDLEQDEKLGEGEEEVDLVDQVYGNTNEDQRLNSKAILEASEHYLRSSLQSETELPTGLQNRALDEQAWAGDKTMSSNVNRNSSGSTSQLLNSTQLTKSTLGISNVSQRKPISLDEYASRMRMAAIMLAQLNASQLTPPPLKSSAAAGMVVGGAIGLGAGFVGVTVGAGLGAVVSRLATSSGQTVITSPIGRRKNSGSLGQGSSGLTTKLDTTHAVTGSVDAPRPINEDTTQPSNSITSTSNTGIPRHKVLTPLQSEAIKDKIMKEMMLLEEERMKRMKEDARKGLKNFNEDFNNLKADQNIILKAVKEDDPSGNMLSESWEIKRERIKQSSPYGHLSNWNVFSVIVKTGADLRQEQLITQLINEFGRIWCEEKCDVWVRYYQILVTGESTGLMETIVDAVSLHSLKKAAYSKLSQQNGESLPNYTIYDHYLETFGEPHTSTFKKAQDKFMRSLVSYSIISYILQLKDRHNGNILIDKEGHLIHIDFGFVLSNSPGSLGFEMAPFKLSQDYIQLLGGIDEFKWIEFLDLFKLAFKKVRKHAERIITIVELMQLDSKLPCFGSGETTIKNIRERFQLGLTSNQCDEFIEKLILSSASSVFTKLYDSFQYYSQGVL
ncbi:hypothetical protein CROQUDRAFT_111621 [Cronartium quercuum f. sp. fusiforme G11]|uniref:1-phosphatidylinositol 4-kinase n=1 Tax=Cronartium quercuum f. sp. fusiforme G11 TaxID=708437 RepID=A0A9P6T597_9BASI|nr:hypothetical protein CROQUDRAFT_111621 [Cronartium quercuum f. sp. fusiforme G11]